MTRQEKLDQLEQKVGHYLRRRLTFYSEIYGVAQKETKPSVIAAIDAVDAWQRTVLLALRTGLQAVNAAPDEPTWDAVDVDVDSFDATLPAAHRLQDLALL